MPKPPAPADPFQWILNLPAGQHCSVGLSDNMVVSADGELAPGGRADEDKFFTCSSNGGKLQVYLVLDGHDGLKACEFAQKHLPGSFLQNEIKDDRSLIDALSSAFAMTERNFFITIDPHIIRKMTLQEEINEKAHNSAEAYRLYPGQVAEIQRLDDEIQGGTTAVMSVVYNNRLYTANCGDSRAVLCYDDMDTGQLVARQISVDHNTYNEGELQRLAEIGLDPHTLKKSKRLGTQQNTRSIGDYSIKGGYSDISTIAHARMEPGTAEPFIASPIDLSNFCGFLLLMSDGLYEAYEAWTHRPSQVNKDIAHLVADEIKKSVDFDFVAQNVVDAVKKVFQKSCQTEKRLGRMDDITLIVRNFGYPALHHSKSLSSMPSVSSSHSVPPHSAPTVGGPRDGGFFPPSTSSQSSQQMPYYSHIPQQPPYPPQSSPYQEFGIMSMPQPGRYEPPPSHPYPTNAQYVNNGGVSSGGGDFYPEPVGNQRQPRPGVFHGGQTNDWPGYSQHRPLHTNAQVPYHHPHSHQPLTAVSSYPSITHSPHMGHRQTSVPVVTHREAFPEQQYSSAPWQNTGAHGHYKRAKDYESTNPLGDLTEDESSTSRSSVYENVTLRAHDNPQPEKKRLSDSQLEDRVRTLKVEDSPQKPSPSPERKISSPSQYSTPPSGRKTPVPAERTFIPIETTPVPAERKQLPTATREDSTPVAETKMSSQLTRRDSDAENMELYGWTGKESQPSSLVPESQTVARETKDYETLREDLATTPTPQETTGGDEEEETMTFNMGEMDEHREPSDQESEEVDGELRPYVKFLDTFPQISWDDIEVQ